MNLNSVMDSVCPPAEQLHIVEQSSSEQSSSEQAVSQQTTTQDSTSLLMTCCYIGQYTLLLIMSNVYCWITQWGMINCSELLQRVKKEFVQVWGCRRVRGCASLVK